MFFEYDKKPLMSLDECEIKVGDRVQIPPSLWVEIRESFTQEAITAHLGNVIKRLPFPIREYTQQEIQDDLNALRAESLKYEVSPWSTPRINTPMNLVYGSKPICLIGNNSGLKVSNIQTQAIRMECGLKKQGAPMEEWRNAHAKKSNFFRCLFGILSEEVSTKGIENSILYRALKMHTYMASQFKPSVAKSIYDLFGAKRVLDFSAGWGDRLVGFLASGAESYVGIDPNTKLHEPYRRISDSVGGTKATEFICSPAEEVNYGGISYDFVFTSPPYFDTERYSEEPTQSWIRHSTLDKWLNGFLFEVLGRVYGGLEDGGRFSVNISDKKGEGNICQPMLEFMDKLGATYEGVIGYKMHKRNGIGLEGNFCEPVFVWSKGGAPEPKWITDNFFGV